MKYHEWDKKDTVHLILFIAGCILLLWIILSLQREWEETGYKRGYETARHELYEEFYKEGYEDGKEAGAKEGYEIGLAEAASDPKEEDRQP